MDSEVTNTVVTTGIPYVYAAIAALVGAAWAAFKGSAWWKERVDGQKAKAFELLEAAAHDVYEQTAHAMKEAAADGKLTADERAQLQAMAYALAKDKGIQVGVQVAKYYGPEIIGAAISKAVRRLKGPKLPDSVTALFEEGGAK